MKILVENFTFTVDINKKSRLTLVGSRLSGVVFLLNPCCPDTSNASLDRFVIGAYELLVKQLEIIKQFSFACTHVYLTINDKYCSLK
jgi:hypothetical protein